MNFLFASLSVLCLVSHLPTISRVSAAHLTNVCRPQDVLFSCLRSEEPFSAPMKVADSIHDPSTEDDDLEYSADIAKDDHVALDLDRVSDERQVANDGDDAPLEDDDLVKPDEQAARLPDATPFASTTENEPLEPAAHAPSKGRFNFASFDCGAIIKSSNAESIASTSILSGNRDSYMLNKCEADKFVVVELCEEILVEAVSIGNFELFSSMFKHIRVFVGNQVPGKAKQSQLSSNKGWVKLADLHAKNSRTEQLFEIPNSVMWTKYLRLEIVSHFGNEFYCPISVLRVFGKTMMEDLRNTDDEEIDRDSPKTDRMSISLKGVGNFLKDFQGMFGENYLSLPRLSFPSHDDENLGEGFASKDGSGADTKESVFKTILKRLSRLEASNEFLAKHQSKLHAVYTNLDKFMQNKVDLFLENLGGKIIQGMDLIVLDYEKLLDSWNADLSRIASDTGKLWFRVNFLLSLALLASFLLSGYAGYFYFYYDNRSRKNREEPIVSEEMTTGGQVFRKRRSSI